MSPQWSPALCAAATYPPGLAEDRKRANVTASLPQATVFVIVPTREQRLCALQIPNPIHPDHLAPKERLAEVCRRLALGRRTGRRGEGLSPASRADCRVRREDPAGRTWEGAKQMIGQMLT